MWTYNVYTIPAQVAAGWPDKVIDRIVEMSAFSKHLGQNPLGVYPDDRRVAFMLVDQEDDINPEELKGLGFTLESEHEGHCECCRGTCGIPT